ncbi:hypothetical protein GCM10017673_21340 [Streptosporangium violaceochromogenes]|nr:hypothetical protein GCM10017673_21340 [Streptosporangium violaceochromogenes]
MINTKEFPGAFPVFLSGGTSLLPKEGNTKVSTETGAIQTVPPGSLVSPATSLAVRDSRVTERQMAGLVLGGGGQS